MAPKKPPKKVLHFVLLYLFLLEKLSLKQHQFREKIHMDKEQGQLLMFYMMKRSGKSNVYQFEEVFLWLRFSVLCYRKSP
jgi:hypothetical protein